MLKRLKLVFIVGVILYLFVGFSLYTVDYFGNPTYDCPNGVTVGGILAPKLINKGCTRKPYVSSNLYNSLVFWLPEFIPVIFE